MCGNQLELVKDHYNYLFDTNKMSFKYFRICKPKVNLKPAVIIAKRCEVISE